MQWKRGALPLGVKRPAWSWPLTSI